ENVSDAAIGRAPAFKDEFEKTKSYHEMRSFTERSSAFDLIPQCGQYIYQGRIPVDGNFIRGITAPVIEIRFGGQATWILALILPAWLRAACQHSRHWRRDAIVLGNAVVRLLGRFRAK